MASEVQEGIVNLITCMEDAKTLCMQMQFRSAAVLLHKQVLEPAILNIDFKRPRAKKFSRIIQPLSKHRRWPKINMQELFCDVFAQLSEISIVYIDQPFSQDSLLHVDDFESETQAYVHFNTLILNGAAGDGVSKEDVCMLWYHAILNPRVRDVLINSEDIGFKPRLRFTGACAQMVFARFHRNEKGSTLNENKNFFFGNESHFLTDSSSAMVELVRDMVAQMKQQKVQLVCNMVAKMKLQAGRPEPRQAFLSQASLLQTMGAFLKSQANDKERIPEIEGWIKVWQLWKEIHFPEEHLEWILCLALTILRTHVRRCQYHLLSAAWSETYRMEAFIADLSTVIGRSIHCRLFLLLSECLRIILEFTVKHSKARNALDFAKSTFFKILKLADQMKDIEISILLHFLDVKSKEVSKMPEAHALFRKLADTMCIANKRAHIRDQDLYTYMHKMSYKLVLISDEWQDIDLMIETLEKFSTSLESFDQQMLGHLGLAYLVKGKQLVKEGNHTEANKWFVKSRKTFSRANDVLKSGTHSLLILNLMLAIYFFDRGNFSQATKLLTSCATAPEQFIPGFKMLYPLLPQAFGHHVKNYMYNDFLAFEKYPLKPEGDFKLRLGVIVRFLLVNCLIELGRKDEAKQTAQELFNAVRLSFRKTCPYYISTMLESILTASSQKGCTQSLTFLADQFADFSMAFWGLGEEFMDPDSKLWCDEMTDDEIRFQDSASRKVMERIYSYDASLSRVRLAPDSSYKSMLLGLLPVKEEIDVNSKKAMYYSITGDTFEMLGLVDSAQNAFERAKFCMDRFPPC